MPQSHPTDVCKIVFVGIFFSCHLKDQDGALVGYLAGPGVVAERAVAESVCGQQCAEGSHTQSCWACSGSGRPGRRLWSKRALGAYDWTSIKSGVEVRGTAPELYDWDYW